jgi:biopolymer transport protein ExbD/biopolymer transport protein TolR
MGMSAGGGTRAVPYINVTPLIDVLLVLLIIFMVVTPLKPKRFKTLVPEPPTNEPQTNVTAASRLLRVDIDGNKLKLYHDKGGTMGADDVGTIDPEHADTTALSTMLNGILSRRDTEGPYRVDQPGIPDKTVFVKAPKSAPYGEVVKVIDAIKGAGGDPVGLQVDSLEK